MSTPEYLYAVVDDDEGPRVERALIQYRTPKTIRFADRVRITGFALVISKGDVRIRRLVETPGAAIAAWRAGGEKTLKQLEEKAAQLRVWLQTSVPNEWGSS